MSDPSDGSNDKIVPADSVAGRPGVFAQVASGTVKYLVIGAVARVLSLVSVPVYLRFLSPEQYGLQAIVLLNEQLLMIIAGYAFTNALGKYYVEAAQAKGDVGVVVGTACRAVLIGGVAVGIVWQIAAGPIAQLTLDASSTSLVATRLVGISFLANVLAVLAMTVWQFDQDYRAFGWATIGQFALAAVLGIALVGPFHAGALGPVVAWVAASVLTALVSMACLLRRMTLSFDPVVLRRLIAYGAPLVPAALVTLVLNGNDRYLLSRFNGLEAVGVYAAVLTIVNGLNSGLIVPFKRIWITLMWKMRNDPGEKAFHKRMFTYYWVGQAWLLSALIVLGDVIMGIVSGGKAEFVQAGIALAVVYAGLALYGSYEFLSAGYFFESRTKYYAATVAIATVTAVGFNLVFIPIWGLWAAASSNPISYLVFAVLSFLFGRRFFRVHYEWGRLAGLAAITAGVSLAGIWARQVGGAGGLLLAGLLLASFPLILLAVRFFDHPERAQARRAVLSGLARLHRRPNTERA